MTKERLRKYRDIVREIRQIEDLLAEVEARMAAPKVPQLTGMPGGGPKDPDKMTGIVARHMALVERYQARLAELEAEQLEIEEAIEALDPRERTLCRLRYIQGKSWEAICVEMSYAWAQTHRLHKQALEKLTRG